ncbi:MAG: class I SAM-dependent methyltransferase [Gammaproteobacteria bacterium]|nr:class I SAM-dependent methyltransferase [Gammaproteobacteria bacterium]
MINRIFICVVTCLLLIPTTNSAEDIAALLDKAITGQHREQNNSARDIYRHPKETLQFVGLQPDMHVLEILPGKGWYTEILAPVLRDNGELAVASFGADYPVEFLSNMHKEFIIKLGANPQVYDKVIVTIFHTKEYLDTIADNSMDMVVTFRNTHNWIKDGVAEEIYKAFFRVTRPGGILGVEQHRAKPGSDPLTSAKNGYVPEAYLIELAEKSGFKLIAKNEINANPKDTKDHPEGVWTLPPTYRLGDKDKEKYTAIGESDRMTLKFIKPE